MVVVCLFYPLKEVGEEGVFYWWMVSLEVCPREHTCPQCMDLGHVGLIYRQI